MIVVNLMMMELKIIPYLMIVILIYNIYHHYYSYHHQYDIRRNLVRLDELKYSTFLAPKKGLNIKTNGNDVEIARSSSALPQAASSSSLTAIASPSSSLTLTTIASSSSSSSSLSLTSSSSLLTSSSTTTRATTSSPPSLFFKKVFEQIKKSQDIVHFSGPFVKRVFGTPGNDKSADLMLTGHVKTKTWSDIVKIMLKTLQEKGKTNTNTVFVYNEHKLGDFLLHIIIESKNMNRMKDNKNINTITSIHNMTINEMHDIMDQGQPSMVMINSMDENWGFLSTPIVNRTTKWINMTNHLLIHNSNYHTLDYFLDSNKLLLLICNTHVDPRVGFHRKVLSVPLGIKDRDRMFTRMTTLSKMNITKTRLLIINNSGWGGRAAINEEVSRNFNYTISNTYDKDHRNHFVEAAESKFVLCPSGLGFDTYRLWESLLLGSIPIVESNSGFDRTYSMLPVLVVKSFSSVTPTLLNNVYPCFERNVHNFRFNHLTLSYWFKLIETALKTGNIDHVIENHPPRNPFCSFHE